MSKNVLREIIILLLLTLAIILLLGVLLYEYVPMNKVIPETVTYTATDEQDIIIRTVIFSVPALIIFAGIVVWQVRRRKK